MNNYSQSQNNTSKKDESLIGIGELPYVKKKNESIIAPHIRYDDQFTKIQDELTSEISLNELQNIQEEEGELAVDVYETADYIYIIAPIAGVKMENIDLSITEDVLQIRGKRSLSKNIPHHNYLIRECFWGNFSRSIILPPNADPSTISASFENAVLKIKIGKFNEGRTRKIEIN